MRRVYILVISDQITSSQVTISQDTWIENIRPSDQMY